MAKQIQIRRGTTAEHENFIGAIGEITMDTDAKTLRIHDGETVGGIPLAHENKKESSNGCDYVIEHSTPGANPWFVKWHSGRCEIGGIVEGKSDGTVTLPFEMADSNYSILTNSRKGDVNDSAYTVNVLSSTPNSFTFANRFASAAYSGFTIRTFNWEVRGWTAV